MLKSDKGDETYLKGKKSWKQQKNHRIFYGIMRNLKKFRREWLIAVCHMVLCYLVHVNTGKILIYAVVLLMSHH